MKVVLLALQHLREQRWTLTAFVIYVFLMALAFGAAGGRPGPEEMQYFARQQAGFTVLFTVLLAAGALHAERRSRRILAVLSKAISRRAYVRSILLAMWMAAALYILTSSVAVLWLGRRAGVQPEQEMSHLGLAFFAAMATAAVAIFFSTFLHPLLATFVSGVLIAVPAFLGQYAAVWLHLSPASALMAHSSGMLVLAGSSSLWYWVTLTLIQTVVFWAAAAFVFTKLDVAVPIE
jgi:ABC-type transport system involved in multi-copper enzyme maturation permease subunit